MLKALILTDAYYDAVEEDNDVLVRPNNALDGVIIEPWPGKSNKVEIGLTREELLAILDLVPAT